MIAASKPDCAASQWLRAAGVGFAVLTLAACASSPAPHAVKGLSQQETFQTPAQAVDAYINAARNNNKPELLHILGPDAATLISSGDAVADKESRKKIINAYEAKHSLESEGEDKNVLLIGNEEWPMPIPIVRVSGGWQWDTDAGKEEILNRRIGRNELTVIEICHSYVQAQREYSEQHYVADGKHEYAQKFISSADKHDGLYWPVNAGEEESPLGPLIAAARAEGYVDAGKHSKYGKHTPYHGYYYKILKQQGPNAAGGARNYVNNGHMTGGFALLAFPAKYGDSGIMSFIVNQNGLVYEKNLGPDTSALVAQITAYDPDASWRLSGSAN